MNITGTSQNTDGLPRRVQRVAAPLREQVLEIVRGAILNFHYKPGQHLVERELIEEIGVSRTTIREVLRELAVEGLITVTPQKGAIVVTPTEEEAAQLYEVRSALETLAVQKFIDRAEPDHYERLAAAYDTYRQTVETNDGDILNLLEAKDNWYDALLEGARNESIRSILTSLQARVRLMRANSLSEPGRPRETVEELGEIMQALVDRDHKRATEACLHHLKCAEASGLAMIAGTTDAEE